MDILFFKVWRNIVIRKEIFKYLLVKHKDKRIFFNDTKQLCESMVNRGEHQVINSIGFTGKKVFISGFKIPDTIISLDIGNKVTDELKIGDIPSSITELIIGQNYNKPFKHGLVPSSVKTIIIGQRFNCQIKPNDLPESITKLEFDRTSRFNQELITNGLPSGIKELSFLGFCEKVFKQGDIPESVTKLSLQYSFRSFEAAIGYLPNSITSLSIEGLSFHLKNIYQSPSILPNSLKTLVIEIPRPHNHSQLSSDFFPNGLTSLTFSTNLSISGLLPPSLTKLVFGSYYNQPILPNDLPSTLTHLEFGERFNHPIDDPGIVPDSIKYLSFGYIFNQPLPSNVLKSNNLHTLILGPRFNQLIRPEDISEPLTTLKYYPGEFQLMQVSKFKSIKNLTFVSDFNQNLNVDYLPPNVTSIEFNDEFSQTLPQLPPFVESIKFGRAFNRHIQPNILPNSLKSIEFGHNYNKPFGEGVLPSSLETIIVGHQFKQDFSKLNLPPSLISFVCPK